MSEGPGRGPLRRILAWLLVAATLGFVGWAIASGWPRLAERDWDIRPLRLAASTALLVVVIAGAGLLWGRVLRSIEPTRVGPASILRIWAHSNLVRYVPGKVWQFVAAAELARSRGLPPAAMLVSLLVYMGFALLAAGVVAVAAGAVPSVPGGVLPAIVAGSAALALVHPAVIDAALRLIPRRAAQVRWSGGWAEGALLLLLCLAYWLANGAAFALFVDGVTAVPAGAWWTLVGANAAAYLVGYLAIVAPAGLGFREATLTALLAGVVGNGVGDPGSLALAGAVALASRLWIVLADLFSAAAVLALDRG
ncbi:MAG TPA: hypothetical protein VK837_09590 [Longimicrobiales bacterium]|nr:hypothetical protein [Longimicrobiales bacterium]